MANKDLKLINGVIEKSKNVYDLEYHSADENSVEQYKQVKKSIKHPLDSDIIREIKKIDIKDDMDDYQIFKYSKEINGIWKLIIEKSIICLRYFDKREPFLLNKKKRPITYGVKELGDYFDVYTEFVSAKHR